MEGGLLIMPKALEALESSPWAKRIGWEVLITPDEETGGSCGSAPLYEKAAKKHHAGLDPLNPLQSDGFAGQQPQRLQQHCCHPTGQTRACRQGFQLKVNALTALARWLSMVEQLTDKTKGITVNIGQIEGGGAFEHRPRICRR